MLVRLRDSGSVFQIERQESDTESSITRRAMLVYAGTFQSMDGEVVVTPAHIKALVASHNSMLSKVKRLASGEVALKNYPPVQADHSTSAWDTVGRVIGELTEEEFETDDGDKVPAVFASVKFLGRENVERVLDGRWTHLSVGADFDAAKLSELTVTPFPAAAGASLLKRGEQTEDKTENDDDDKGGTSEMNREKLKKYLMDCKKMSAEDADKELDRLSSEENKEELSKLSGEEDEYTSKLAAEDADKEEKEKKEKEEKLTAARAEITRLSTDFRSNLDNAKLAATQGRITTRLSKLRADGKVTPAEIKKMDIAKLSKSSPEAIEAVMKTYEDREPVIQTGQLGSIKAEELSKLTSKVRMSRLEAETRANMPLLSRADKNRRLAEGDGAAPVDRTVPYPDENPANELSYEAEYQHICMMIDQGNGNGAKEALKALVERITASATALSAETQTNTLETENHLSALAASIEKMQTQFDGIQRLASSLVG